MAVAEDTSEVEPPQRRLAVRIGVIGNVLVWYDFSLYIYLSPIIAQLFFPNATRSFTIPLSIAVIVVMRPVGALAFGIYGDRFGRRNALGATMLLMAAATVVLGCLPTYQQAGILAPALLVFVRLIQGFAAGGEWGGSTTYIVELARNGRRGYTGSWQQVGVGAGLLAGSLAATLLNVAMSHEAVLAGGWRIPFLLGIVLGGVGAFMRWRLGDTSKFTEMAAKGESAAAPHVEALTTYRRATWTGFGITVHNTVVYYAVMIYMPNYLAKIVALPQSSSLAVSIIGLFVFIILVPFMGALSDRVGRKPLLLASTIGYAVLTVPLFLMASTARFELALLAQLIFVIMLSFYAGACPATYAELFPTRVRCTAVSIGYNTAVAIFSGLAPFIANTLIELTGYSIAPTLYVVAAAVTSLLVLRTMTETAFSPLR